MIKKIIYLMLAIFMGIGVVYVDYQNNQYQQKHEQMYRSVPEYNGQDKFVQKTSRGKKGFIASFNSSLLEFLLIIVESIIDTPHIHVTSFVISKNSPFVIAVNNR